jgi:hypothetical protein
MGVTTTNNKPINPRGNDQSPKGYNRAALYSGKALDFDGVNDKVNITTDSFDLYSVSFYYIGAIGTAANGTAFSSGTTNVNDGVTLGAFTGTLTNETITIGKDGNYTATNKTFADGVHFICASWDATNSKYKIYVNGQEVDTFNNGSDAALNTGITAPALGYRKLLSDQYMEGGLSNVRAFSTALTAAQVADLYNNPEKVVPTGVADSALKLWLPMMEGAGTTAYDGSGNGNHGTISGATYVNGIGAPVAQTAVIDWNKGSNLVTYSEEFDQWTQNISNVTANDTTAPDGQETADKWIPDSGTTSANLRRNSSDIATGTDYVFFCFAKAAGFDVIELDFQNSRFSDVTASFNLTSGTITATGGDNVTEGIIDKGNGWYLCYIVGNSIVSGSNTCIFRQNNSTGDGSKGYYLWGAGFNQASNIVPYVRTSNVIQGGSVLLPQGLTTGRDITGVNLFENVRKQGALNLDGNSWAEVHDNASLDVSEITAEGWMYTESITGTNNRIVNKWNSGYPERSFQLYGQHATINWMLSDGSAAYSITGGTLTQGQWFHVVGTYDGSTQKIYLNGVEVATTALSITLKQSSFKVMLGGYATGVYSLNPIAQPRIYNRALTAEEVLQNYNSGKNTYK